MIDDLKPYSAMKDSGVPWLGEVPEHWRLQRMKTLLRERAQKGFPDEPLLAATQSKGVVRKERYENRTVLALKDLHLLKLVRVGDFVISLRSFQGGIEFAREQGIISPAYTILYATAPEMHGYLARLFKSAPYVDNLSLFVTGIRQGQNIDFEQLARAVVPVPPHAEQAAIGRFLDHADRRIRRYIRAKQKLIKLLEEQKQAIVHRAVTRGLDPNVRLKPSGVEWFGDVPAHWEVLTLRRVITRAVDGPHHSPRYLDRGIPFLSARNIKADRWSLGDAKYISEADYAEFSKRVVPEVGDVLYTKGGTTGVARAVDLRFRFQVWVHVAVLKVQRHKVLPEYLALVLNSPRCYEQAQLFTRGATNQDLGLGRMKGIVLALPQLSEQKALLRLIEERTRALNDAAERARREIELLREYRVRLIADVVTGKLDVREAAARLSEGTEEPEPLDEAAAEAERDEAVDDSADDIPEETEA
jgi:type I restriction enzyme S subunit